MDEFANTITLNHQSLDMKKVTIAYFQFWEQYIDVLLLLKKSHILYFIEDNFDSLIINVAKKVKHIPENLAMESSENYYDHYKYEFYVKLAGLWKATIIWCEETSRKSPVEIAEIITNLFKT